MNEARLKNIIRIATVLMFVAFALATVATAKDNKGWQEKPFRLFDIQGYRLGMTMEEVKKILSARKIEGYETGFSDLYVYAPTPDSELRLLFSCTGKDLVVSGVELSLPLDKTDAVKDLRRYGEQLRAKYGPPAKTAASKDKMDSCWGRCNATKGGDSMLAKTKAAGNGKKLLTLLLHSDSLEQACSKIRKNKINSWLYDWIAFASRFRPGMTLDAATAVYTEWYGEGPSVDEVLDQNDSGLPMKNYVVSEHEYFEDLDADSRNFEGEGPGNIMLKFTGPQIGKGVMARRLYSCSLATTKFKGTNYLDFNKKLDLFIQAYGRPTEIAADIDGLSARWKKGSITRSLKINGNGFITLEQSDLSVRDAYRRTVAKIEKQNEKKHQKELFYLLK